MFANAGSCEIVVIYSAEGVQYSAGSEKFMGDWLALNPIPYAEDYYVAEYDANYPTRKDRMRGFQWYEYAFAKLYARDPQPPISATIPPFTQVPTPVPAPTTQVPATTTSAPVTPVPAPTTQAPATTTTSAPVTTTSAPPTTTSTPPTTPVPTSIPATPPTSIAPAASSTHPVYTGIQWQNIAWCGGDGTSCQSTSFVRPTDALVIVDLFDTPVSTIQSLKSRPSPLPPRIVICYYSAGSYEAWRSDSANFTAAVLGDKMSGWDERWLNITNATALAQVKAIMTWRLQLAVQKGCDGVEPDNVDCFQNTKCRGSYPVSAVRDAQIDYNIWTARTSRDLGLLVGLKNSLDLVTTLEPYYNFSVNEACQQYNECQMLLPFLRNGKAVLQTEYNNVAQVCPRLYQGAQGALNFSTKYNNNSRWVDCIVNTTGNTNATVAVPDVPPTTAVPTVVPSTTSAPQSPEPPVPAPTGRPAIRLRIRIRGDRFALILQDADKRVRLVIAVRRDLSRLLRIAFQFIIVRSMQEGSLIVDYDVHDPNATVVDSQASLDAQVGESQWLTETQAVYGEVSNETLVLASAEAQPGNAVDSPASSLCGSALRQNDCGVLIMLMVLVGVLFIAALAVFCICKKCAPDQRAKSKKYQNSPAETPTEMENPTRREFRDV